MRVRTIRKRLVQISKEYPDIGIVSTNGQTK